MVTKEPGWYPDPQGAQQVRFWDGDTWTDYTQPFAPLTDAGHGPATALEDYPYLAEADLHAAHGPRTVSTWTPVPVAPVLAPRVRRPGRAGLVAWSIGGALLVVVIGVVAVNALTGSDPEASPTPVPSPSSTVTLDPIGPGQDGRGSLPAGGELLVTVTIETAGTYFVGATSSQDVALTLTPTGTTDSLAVPDDRGELLTTWYGGGWADPGYFLDLEAGSYDVVVTERTGEATDVTVALDPVTALDLTPGIPQEVTLGDADHAVLRIVAEEAAPFVLDARAADDGLDGQLSYLSGSRLTSLDDRGSSRAQSTGGSEYDPLIEIDLAPGTTFVILDEISGEPGRFTLTSTLG